MNALIATEMRIGGSLHPVVRVRKSCQEIYFATRHQRLARLEVPKTALREKSSW